MYKIRDWCIGAIDCSISPDIGVVAESHDPWVKVLVVLFFKEQRKLISEPTRLFKTSLGLMLASKSIPGMPSKTVQHDNTVL